MVDSGFDYLGNLVWSLPIGSEFTSLPFLSIFKHLPENEVTQLERSRLDLLVVVALDLMLVVLNAK